MTDELHEPETPAEGELTLESHFSIVPEWVLFAEISDRALRLYGVLLRYGQSSGQRMPGRAELAMRLRCHKTSVDRASLELQALGALTVKKRSNGKRKLTNLYIVRSSPPSSGEVTSRTHAPRSPGSARATTPSRTSGDLPSSSSYPKNPHPPVVVPIDDAPSARGAAETEKWPPALGDVVELCSKARVDRRERGYPNGRWTDKHIKVAIRACLDDGRDPKLIPDALYGVSIDPETKVPNRLREQGPWWDGMATILKLDRARARRATVEEADDIAQRGLECQRQVLDELPDETLERLFQEARALGDIETNDEDLRQSVIVGRALNLAISDGLIEGDPVVLPFPVRAAR